MNIFGMIKSLKGDNCLQKSCKIVKVFLKVEKFHRKVEKFHRKVSSKSLTEKLKMSHRKVVLGEEVRPECLGCRNEQKQKRQTLLEYRHLKQ